MQALEVFRFLSHNQGLLSLLNAQQNNKPKQSIKQEGVRAIKIKRQGGLFTSKMIADLQKKEIN